MKRVISTLLLFIVLTVLFIVPAQAQDETMVRYYIIPIQRVGTNRGPMYFTWGIGPEKYPGINCQWSLKDYGLIDLGVIAADITLADHNALITHADVFAISDQLDTAIGNQNLSALTTFLEGVFIPADWLRATDTWRYVLRTVTGMMLFMQRLTAITGNTPLNWGISLNTQFRNILTGYQVAIVQAYTDLGYDSSVIRSNWTIRVLLKNTADQWGTKPIYFGFTTL